MKKASTASSCPLYERDAGSFSLTRKHKATYYCAVCRTRIFFNSNKALVTFAAMCTGPDGRPLFVDNDVGEAEEDYG